MALMAMAILGTQSRGALLAILAMALALGLKSRRPVRASAAILAIVMLAIAFMPKSWDQRMETIQTYQQDDSAMSRIYTWKTLWALALDRPLVGAGFGADNAGVFNTYAPTEPEFEGFRRAGTVLVAHSIYFQALGEHGFVGLIAYLLIGLLAYRKASRLSASTAQDSEFATWVPLLMRMAQASLVGFAVGGAFLSLMNFDVPFYIVGIIVLTDATVRERASTRRLAATWVLGHPRREGRRLESPGRRLSHSPRFSRGSGPCERVLGDQAARRSRDRAEHACPGSRHRSASDWHVHALRGRAKAFDPDLSPRPGGIRSVVPERDRRSAFPSIDGAGACGLSRLAARRSSPRAGTRGAAVARAGNHLRRRLCRQPRHRSTHPAPDGAPRDGLRGQWLS